MNKLKTIVFDLDYTQYTGYDQFNELIDATIPDLFPAFKQVIIDNYETIREEITKYIIEMPTPTQIKAYFDQFYKNPKNLDFFRLFPEKNRSLYF